LWQGLSLLGARGGGGRPFRGLLLGGNMMGEKTHQQKAEDQRRDPAEILVEYCFHEQLSTGLLRYREPYDTLPVMSSNF
jgi:hypothetical protein